MNAILDAIFTLPINARFGLLLYWLPLVTCLVLYTLRTIENYKKDVEKRAYCKRTGNYYHPTDTIGTIIGRLIGSVLPVFNLLALVFDALPQVCKWVSQFMDIPLVPHRDIVK